ncbi:sigma factor-like helix-turn-helix DNA-binding protein [Brachyspira alvinipulli]|uniref:sigma factor-like helix-turn-helix DNA-binding protein n=1 Tax=Brachyspira alvinipulli TaxID=84379 RepID=UPI0026165766|nr:sigma factor-like helix-turn-helix DNA-binding protein [uncultured Brachyspira sp.]
MCNLCPKYETCNKLCDKVLNEINKSIGKKRKHNIDNTDSREVLLTNDDLDNIIYANSLTNNEYSRLSNLVIAILTPKQKELLKLFSEGKTQSELAEIFNVTQSSISQNIKAIKKEIFSQFKMVIEI